MLCEFNAETIVLLLFFRILLGATCGNGIVESGENCDDGNTTNGDGCSSICFKECSFTCSIDSTVLVPGGSANVVTASITNNSLVSCIWVGFAFSSSVDVSLTDPVTGQPFQGQGTLASGAHVDILLNASASASSNANQGSAHNYTLFNDGEGYCEDTAAACLIPDHENTRFDHWSGTFGQFIPTVVAGTATFHNRTVGETFVSTEVTDSCWYEGSYYAYGLGGTPFGGHTWTIQAASNDFVGFDSVGVSAQVLKWYEGNQSNMTSSQLAAINSGAATAPPLLSTTCPTPPCLCEMSQVQHMKAFCEEGEIFPFQPYTDGGILFDVVANPDGENVQRGNSPLETLPYP